MLNFCPPPLLSIVSPCSRPSCKANGGKIDSTYWVMGVRVTWLNPYTTTDINMFVNAPIWLATWMRRYSLVRRISTKITKFKSKIHSHRKKEEEVWADDSTYIAQKLRKRGFKITIYRPIYMRPVICKHTTAFEKNVATMRDIAKSESAYEYRRIATIRKLLCFIKWKTQISTVCMSKEASKW